MSNDNEQISELLFLCPHTNRPMNTGVWTNYRTLAKVLDCTMHLRCAHCGMDHDCRIRDGLLDHAVSLDERLSGGLFGRHNSPAAAPHAPIIVPTTARQPAVIDA